MATYTESTVLFNNHVLYRKSLGTQTTQNDSNARVTWFTVPAGKYLRFLSIYPDSQPGFGGSEDHDFYMYMVKDGLLSEATAKGTNLPSDEYAIQLSQAVIGDSNQDNYIDGSVFLNQRHVGQRIYYNCQPVYDDNVSSVSYSSARNQQFPSSNGGYPNGYPDISHGQLFEGYNFVDRTFPYFEPGTVIKYNRPSIAGPSPENYNIHIAYYLADYAGLGVSPTAS